jgi:Domain of unknown function (DUF4384)
MKSCRKLILAALIPTLLLCTFSFALAASAAEREKKVPKFRWAFGAIRGTASNPKVEAVTTNIVLSSGDKLKIMIELKNKCFVYLIHNNTQGEVTMLFPYNLKQFDADYQIARRYYVPKGDAWFQLDDKKGKETFYLIASDQRLLDVEYAYEKYVSADPAKREELAGQMLAMLGEFGEQQLASSGQGEILAQNEAGERGFERATGADPTDIAVLASDIAFNNIYSETFVIDHR